MKELKDYLHLYMGCEVEFGFEDKKKIGRLTGKVELWGWEVFDASSVFNLYQKVRPELIKPILRPLSDMTDEEMTELIQLTVPENIEDKPTDEDYDVRMFYNDGGNDVDADVAIGCNFSCICYDGQVAIRKCGSIHFYDEEGEITLSYNTPKVYAYLLSKHFDIFNLIESGLAIDKTAITA